jgi:hypothetical protein
MILDNLAKKILSGLVIAGHRDRYGSVPEISEPLAQRLQFKKLVIDGYQDSSEPVERGLTRARPWKSRAQMV